MDNAVQLNVAIDSTQECSLKNQYYATSIVFLLNVAYGVVTGWTSPAAIILMSDDSPLASGKMTMDQASWAAALGAAAGIFASLTFGYTAANFGRRKPILFFTVPMIASWLLILFALTPMYLYIARFISGFFGISTYTISLVFQSEIADDRVRGALITIVIVAECVGNLLVYIIGSFSYNAMCIFPIILIAISAVLLYFLPETPLYLVKTDRISESENSIYFYKNIHKTCANADKILKFEIRKLKAIITDDQNASDIKESLKFSDFTTKPARKALALGIVLVGLYLWNGSYALSAYITNIFEQTGSILSPNMSTIVIGIVQVVGTCVAAATVDHFGRKPLIAVSGIGTSIGLTALGIYMMLKSWNMNVEIMNWIPLITFAGITFISLMGIQSLPMAILSEIMPERVKEPAIGFCMTLNWFSAFINMKYSPHLIATIGFQWTMYMFAAMCLFFTLIILIFLPETKGKTHEEIIKMLERNKCFD